ncbi:hypothetical protein XELAEV_18029014mg [Xenopus laevis]|uniref:Uncharacterized protein n=1 Tax=Xenopus laevis TaxID=8355 RepID=A0A974CR86_XENLA|nr:hypothetical protein XELAEV_18029014mg [Xenopus laevis]
MMNQQESVLSALYDSVANQCSENNIKVVTFRSRKIKAQIEPESISEEIQKFGITGYRKEKQRTFEQERAIMLGSKKTLDPVKKKQRRRQEVKKPKNGSSSRDFVPAGQVGRFKNGALILSSLDIKKIKQSKVIK